MADSQEVDASSISLLPLNRQDEFANGILSGLDLKDYPMALHIRRGWHLDNHLIFIVSLEFFYGL